MNEEKAKNNKKIFLIVILIVCFSSTCILGFGNANDTIVIKADEEIVYQCKMVDELIFGMNEDINKAKDMYNNKYFCLLAHVSYVDNNYKRFTVCSVDNHSIRSSIECSENSNDMKDIISTLHPGQNVLIYCKVNVSTWPTQKIEINSIQNIQEIAVDYIFDGEYYSLIDGTMLNIESENNRILADGKINYYIDDRWENVEYELPKAASRYRIDGYYYKLNEIVGEYEESPEYAFIFYFDNNILLTNNQKDFDEKNLIEQAIVDNIIVDGTIGGIVNHEVDYGAILDFCVARYTDVNDISHRVEFVFEPVGNNEGFMVLIYVYTEANNVDDLLFLLRTMDVE